MEQKHTQGFTLIELSIVIIIIGLITVAIIGGQSIIRQANIRSIISEISSFQTAIRTFKISYAQLPGDIAAATDYWPDDSAYNGFATENGDGNDLIEDDPLSREDLRAWQHLSAAEIIPGAFSGQLSGGSIDIGSNVPESSVSQGGYWLVYEDDVYGKRGNVIHFAAVENNNLTGGIVTSPEALSIDEKMDDSIPDDGDIVTINDQDFIDSCVASSGGEIIYVKSNKEQTCHIIYHVTD